MQSLVLLIGLHGASCEQLSERLQSLQAQWNFFTFASHGVAVSDLGDVPLQRSLAQAIRRYNQSCQ